MNTIYQFLSPFLDTKMSFFFFFRNMEPLICLAELTNWFYRCFRTILRAKHFKSQGERRIFFECGVALLSPFFTFIPLYFFFFFFFFFLLFLFYYYYWTLNIVKYRISVHAFSKRRGRRREEEGEKEARM